MLDGVTGDSEAPVSRVWTSDTKIVWNSGERSLRQVKTIGARSIGFSGVQSMEVVAMVAEESMQTVPLQRG